MPKILAKLIIFCSLFTILSCHRKSEVTNGAYFWNSRNFYEYFSERELLAMKCNKIKKYYCKLTDVVFDRDYHARPTTIYSLPTVDSFQQEILVPCIYFTNEVMLQSTKEELEYMANKIATRVNELKVKEFQIDCDWSETSKDNYFHFIRELKKKLNKETAISATIRLYQYKYFEKAGVPPVDRGMLMLYNFNPPTTYNGKNAVFEMQEAKKYLNDIDYPLPLDFAMAHYTWHILYDIDNNFIGFVNPEDTKNILNIATQQKDTNCYVLKEDISLEGYFARKGQKLVKHETNAATIQQSVDLIQDIKNTAKYSVAIFDMNEKTTNYLLSNESIFKKVLP